nr:multiubiquitin domain-containing protein [uncultured Cohaesibacter sp.]
MKNQDTFQYELDGKAIITPDSIVTGRGIRASAGLNPASEYILIELGNLTSRSIGLEEEVNLAEISSPIFRSFKGDRTFSFTINERGYEWGDEEISADDIRAIASIPDDQELILDSDRDRPIDDDDRVRLKSKGVERILSRPAEQICIIVNTRQKFVSPGRISFAQLVALAFPDLPIGPNTAFTVSYRKGRGDKPEGTLIEGESIKVKKGMVFNASATDKS